MDMRPMDLDHLFGCVQPSTGPLHLSMQEVGTVSFHPGVHARQLVVLSGIHYFDAHRLQKVTVTFEPLGQRPGRRP